MGEIGTKLRIMLLAAAALAMSCGNALAGWTLTNLSSEGNILESAASSINNNGDIVGRAQFSGSGYEHASLWHNGVAYDLGVLSGGTGSVASFISDSGLIVGNSWTGEIGQGQHAASFGFNFSTNQVGNPTDLYPSSIYYANGAFNYATDSWAFGVSPSGQIVGHAWSDFGGIHGVLWTNGPTTAQSMDPAWSTQTSVGSINSKGLMAGYTVPNNTHWTATLWDTDGVKLLDSYLPSNTASWAVDINESGQVLINATDSNGWFSAIYSNGNVKVLPIFQGWTNATGARMNNLGQVVGTAKDANGDMHAVFWGNDGSIIDLNSLAEVNGWYLDTATDINDKGQILLYANRFNRSDRPATDALLLTPDAAPVPIPAALPLFASGLAALGVFRRRFFTA